MKSVYALGALAAASTAHAMGKAIVKNSCDYDALYWNTPADGQTTVTPPGKFVEAQVDSGVISPGDQYTFEYAALFRSTGAAGDGWSIKLSPTCLTCNITQFETTVNNDGTVWFDISNVDGEGWVGEWMLTSNDDSRCVPHQRYYRYATDDVNAMQACPDDVDVIMTLCEKADSTGTPSAADTPSAIAPLSTSSAVQSTWSSTQAPALSTTEVATEAPPASSLTTLATSASSTASWSHGNWANKAVVNDDAVTAANDNVVAVTETATHIVQVTATAFVTGSRHSRHDRRHAH